MVKNKIVLICEKDPHFVINGLTAANNSLLRSIPHPFDLVVFDNLKSQDLILKRISQFEIVFFGSSLLAKKLIPFLRNDQLILTQISDCSTHATIVDVKLLWKFNIFNIRNIFRIVKTYLRERYVAKKSNLLLVQTQRDNELVQKYFPNSQCLIVPNCIERNDLLIVDDSVFSSFKIGWTASFIGIYEKIACSFFETYLLDYFLLNPHIKLTLIGVGSKELVSKLQRKNKSLITNISFQPRVANIIDFYIHQKVHLSPIFKGHGFINKTVEPMSIGSVVVGDIAAFNGLEVSHGKHCFIASSKNTWTNCLDQVFAQPRKDFDTIGKNARKLVQETFKIQDNRSKIEAYLDSRQKDFTT